MYCRGNLKLLDSECFAVVGTRKLTSYGKEVARNITTGLVRAGFIIVSGLAMGIDAVAHQATLDAGGGTIAVLGGGVSDQKIGPKINLPLAKKILENNGLLMSEYSDKEDIRASNFAVRDRIISGLSRGVLVIEAGEGSGALITAKCAVDQNRDVFAVPGNIFSSRSIGPNDLIKKGAKLVTSVQDIVEEYGHNLRLFNKRVNTISTKNPTERNVVAILEKKGEATADEIIDGLSEDTPKVIAAISTLEIKGVIKQKGEKYYT
ncbi:MAG: DNA protecting protein DprA [Candidatus Yanofskybacteria bacterium RIFCSPHIGHO2_01_FULL_43_42]|uniref:DNA protecting protein DprA n=1 Tax=Candidatus Yanofskybacteria bacterium RIFCSPLOWO2_01_FULL_43_22 TaxID=1802695 RepID=A0A1F8GFG3_9BACT|nr:MAG: DNA protecting protein DprA [Candidatus Yanofskybacteria bacterium RIFCSPHIGHO2_01_FULL_43_42]OGN13413.1 MAG: DNA protecting protein DprA [Candidatus Yanofskybacteria bacterium RIFCSPHIGHO2_02_FULL_43_17]OGN23466.1 MAG: DNA protecting protein DprA [Candidatus Yanofskybacteria bacterium RIFCSPLOWO2_01_FULL_43_22]